MSVLSTMLQQSSTRDDARCGASLGPSSGRGRVASVGPQAILILPVVRERFLFLFWVLWVTLVVVATSVSASERELTFDHDSRIGDFIAVESAGVSPWVALVPGSEPVHAVWSPDAATGALGEAVFDAWSRLIPHAANRPEGGAARGNGGETETGGRSDSNSRNGRGRDSGAAAVWLDSETFATRYTATEGFSSSLRPKHSGDEVRDVLVFVPGYLGRVGNFSAAGVLAPLVASGWVDAGAVLATGFGAVFTSEVSAASRVMYQIGLPSDQGVELQTQWLDVLVRGISDRHPQARLHFVGHSAGGVVARFLVLTRRVPAAATVVTIASPNGGSEWAEIGQMIGDSPMGILTPFFGLPDLREGAGLMRDLGRSRPGTLLGWMNAQPHPDLRWVSIVRANDEIVAPWSQDLGRVGPLRGKVETLVSPAGHALTPADGTILAAIFAAVTRESDSTR
ncbi:MAG: esterase/lipase family protein [Thioalkalivibrionaceae bacterium]